MTVYMLFVIHKFLSILPQLLDFPLICSSQMSFFYWFMSSRKISIPTFRLQTDLDV